MAASIGVVARPRRRRSRGRGRARAPRRRRCRSHAGHAETRRRPRPDRRPRPHRRPRAAAGRGGRRPRRADRRGRRGPRRPAADRPADARRRPRAAGPCSPGLPGRPRPPDLRRASTGSSATLREHARPRRVPRRDRGVRARANPDDEWIVGSGWYMADFPGGTPRREDLDAVVPTGRPSCRTATATTPGSTRRALELAGHRPRHAGPGRRPDRARPGRDADRARSTRAPRDLVERLIPEPTPTTS